VRTAGKGGPGGKKIGQSKTNSVERKSDPREAKVGPGSAFALGLTKGKGGDGRCLWRRGRGESVDAKKLTRKKVKKGGKNTSHYMGVESLIRIGLS